MTKNTDFRVGQLIRWNPHVRWLPENGIILLITHVERVKIGLSSREAISVHCLSAHYGWDHFAESFVGSEYSSIEIVQEMES